MNSSHCIQGCYNLTGCLSLLNCVNQYEINLENLLDAPMPWIGLYIAAASAACSLAMAADVINGFRGKKFRIPCKYFSLNAITLTILAVTVKLPVDLTSNTLGSNDKFARLSSLLLMSTAMGNIMTSLGSMENNEIILNLAALGIMVITIAGNVFIHNFQIRTLDAQTQRLAEEVLATVVMILVLFNLCSSAIMVPSAKRYIESKYNEMRKRVSNEGGDELRVVVKKYWVMAVTGNLQFVMARSAISGTAGLMCLTMALTLVQAYVRDLDHVSSEKTSSNYRWSINWILHIQSVGVVLGTIAPLFRWYIAAWFNFPKAVRMRSLEESKTEKYWTAKLVEWRDSSLPVQIRHHKFKKLLHAAKRFVLHACIIFQLLSVEAGTLVLHFSALVEGALIFCFRNMKNWKRSDSKAPTESKAAPDPLDPSPYVLLLEGENQLPKKILINICNELDKMIEMGEKKQPKNLIELLRKSVNCNGVREFDSFKVPSLHSQEPPNCWSLPLVTLTSIAIALPTITENEALQLLSGVTEGLSLVKFIEKTIDKNRELESIFDATDMVWPGVELYRKWQDIDLQIISHKGGTHKQTLQKLSSIAEKTVKDFMAKTTDDLMQNPLNWPAKVIAANSMYRVTQTILLAHKDDEEHQTNEELFDRLSIIISDILTACLTNLAHVITLKCHRNGIKGEESVRQAAVLVGESREIFEIIQQREHPGMDAENAADIDKWRANMEQDSEDPPASISASPEPNQDHVSIELQG